MRVRCSKYSSLLLLVKETEGSALSSDPPPPIVTVSQAFSLTTRFQNISKQDRARLEKVARKAGKDFGQYWKHFVTEEVNKTPTHMNLMALEILNTSYMFTVTKTRTRKLHFNHVLKKHYLLTSLKIFLTKIQIY